MRAGAWPDRIFAAIAGGGVPLTVRAAQRRQLAAVAARNAWRPVFGQAGLPADSRPVVRAAPVPYHGATILGAPRYRRRDV
jgi:hypothetical protein